MDRPALNNELDSQTFLSYYYLKEELTEFCRKNGLPVSGGKPELTERIARYLSTGEILPCQKARRKATEIGEIGELTPIESDFVYSEKRRAYFEQRIGKSFSFNVPFQKWLKENAGKTYGDAVTAYRRIAEAKKTTKTEIGKQFEYNTYIRDFFADNAGKTLRDAIRCWNYKKKSKGSHAYEKTDLVALSQR